MLDVSTAAAKFWMPGMPILVQSVLIRGTCRVMSEEHEESCMSILPHLADTCHFSRDGVLQKG